MEFFCSVAAICNVDKVVCKKVQKAAKEGSEAPLLYRIEIIEQGWDGSRMIDRGNTIL